MCILDSGAPRIAVNNAMMQQLPETQRVLSTLEDQILKEQSCEVLITSGSYWAPSFPMVVHGPVPWVNIQGLPARCWAPCKRERTASASHRGYSAPCRNEPLSFIYLKKNTEKERRPWAKRKNKDICWNKPTIFCWCVMQDSDDSIWEKTCRQ